MIDLKDFGKKHVFMPDATRGAVRFLTTEQLKATGTEAIVTNTLHLPSQKRHSMQKYLAICINCVKIFPYYVINHIKRKYKAWYS